VTDDELLQLYVDHGVAPPPPPMGSGKIEVGEQDEKDSSAEAPAESNEAGQESNASQAAAAD
jgi:hypothetical protein